MQQKEFIRIMREALLTPHGLFLQVSHVGNAVSGFHTARRAAGGPELGTLTFRRVSLPDANLAIVHGASFSPAPAPAPANLPPELDL